MAVGLVCLALMPCARGAEWTVLEHCRLVENPSNDGDSFVVESVVPYRGERKNRYRLYFVDTAETDSNSDFKRNRLKEQAAYWERGNPDFALQMGLRAKQTVAQWMRSGFTVYTRGDCAPSLGAPRYYALIRFQEGWLDERLVADGLVRLYGADTDLPDGTSADRHWQQLRALERSARAFRVNGWRNTQPVRPSVENQDVQRNDTVLARDTWIYSTRDGSKVMALLKGTPVHVLEPAAGSRMRIRFEQTGRVYEGLCEKSSLQ
jgi:endonuclease YncB( thermonuclease family)